MNEGTSQNSKLILAAMIFAVSMTFIDQTIVAIAIPTIQGDLSLSATGVQWIVNGYLLSLSALFAFGDRLADIAGRRRMVTLGVIVFAVASSRTVFYCLAAAMVVAFVVALVGMPSGKVEEGAEPAATTYS
jgi:MFS family permease